MAKDGLTKNQPSTPANVEAIRLGRYLLIETGLEIDEVGGRPSIEEHESVGEFIRRSHKASGWWLADWLAYGEKRTDWHEKLEQLIDQGVYSEGTIKNIKYLGENVTKSHRVKGVDISLHMEVAPLKPKEQDHWLALAEKEGWTRSELRKEIRASKRTKVLDGQAKLEGMFRVLYADPPWLYGDSGATPTGALGKAARHYLGMSIDALCKLPVAAHALPDSVLFLWVTAPMLMENPGPREVIEAWGFKPKTGMVWDKVLGNYGHYVRVHHEHLLICTRGSCMPDEPTPMPDSVQVIRRSSEHSAKPDEFRKIIKKLYTRGPYLELFGRSHHEGWTTFGNDARLWGEQHEAQAPA